MDPNKLNNVILFTSDRKLRFLARKCLEILEERCSYIKSLETTLIKMGVGNYEDSKVEYSADRKVILDELGAAVREIEQLRNMVN